MKTKKPNNRPGTLSRRRLLKGFAAAAGLASAGATSLLHRPRPAYSADGSGNERFLITLAAAGGASIIDAMLAIRHSESNNFENINCFPDNEVISVPDSPFRAVDRSNGSVGPIPFPYTAQQSTFVNKHKADMMVATLTTTSVNHTVGQKRAVTGNNAWAGRTLAEAVAAEYGANCPLANVNMATGGYLERGDDRSVPTYALPEPVAQAALWPLSLDGRKGFPDAPDPELVDLARSLRNDHLDEESVFYRTFALSDRLERWKRQRGGSLTYEQLDLISKLNFLPESPELPFSQYGLSSSPDAERVSALFPNAIVDPLEAQAALAFLLIKYRVSVSVSIGPGFGGILLPGNQLINPPLAYDFSHTNHRDGQAVMWNQILTVADKLIGLLKSEEFGDTGESLWDRTAIYVATDFGRSKNRPGATASFGSGHDLNNGVLLISPLVNGNTVLGGVDPETGLTYGFNPQTGAPDTNRTMAEAEIFAGIVQAMGIDTTGSGLPSVPAMSRGT